jgi:hypothetical protein
MAMGDRSWYRRRVAMGHDPENAMRRFRCLLGLPTAVLAVLALDPAVIRSLTCTKAGSNQLLYMVPVDGADLLTFERFAFQMVVDGRDHVDRTVFNPIHHFRGLSRRSQLFPFDAD